MAVLRPADTGRPWWTAWLDFPQKGCRSHPLCAVPTRVYGEDGVCYRLLFLKNGVMRQRDINPTRMYVDNN